MSLITVTPGLVKVGVKFTKRDIKYSSLSRFRLLLNTECYPTVLPCPHLLGLVIPEVILIELL